LECGRKFPLVSRKLLDIAVPLELLRPKLFAALRPFTEAVEAVFSRASVVVPFFHFSHVVIPRLLVLCSAPANPDCAVVVGSQGK